MAAGLGALEIFLNSWQSAPRDRCARSDGLVGPVEGVPGERMNVGPQYQIGVAFPNLELMLLCGAHCPRYHLKYIGWRSAVGVLDPHRHAQHKFGAHFACRPGRNWSDEPAVGQAACADLYRLEQA